MHRVSVPLSRMVIATLIREQESEGWTDLRMAREINMEHSAWNLIHNGKRGIGIDGMILAATRFSSVRNLVIAFFARLGANELLSDVTDQYQKRGA